MKIILDEDTPYPIRPHLSGHEVETVVRMGWGGLTNGELLGLIEENGFDAFITCDKNLEHQQNLATRSFAVIVFTASDKKMATLFPLVPKLLLILSTVETGRVYHVGSPA